MVALGLSQELSMKKEMGKIWDGNPSKSEIIGRCGADEKTNHHAEPTVEYKNKIS